MFVKARFFRALTIMLILFPLLGCISMSYFIDMDDDASGKGTIYQTITFPDLGESGAGAFDSYIQRLYDEGWQNIEISSPGNGLAQVTASYNLDPNSGVGFPDSIKNFSITVEEFENGYKYFTAHGNFDFSQLQEFWDKIKNSDDASFSYDFGPLFGGPKTMVSKAEIDNFIQQYGEPKIEFKLKLPGNTPVETKGPWRNSQDYMNGKTDIIEYSWQPGQKTNGTLIVSRRWEPQTSVSEDDLTTNLFNLTNAYIQEIPYGVAINILEMPTGGWFNNLLFAHVIGEVRTCGSYQNYVMDFLDRVRTSTDPEVRSMLNGYDYGPIQTNGGGHVAVVVFPSGTDWHDTGMVFDPWPTQKPMTYDIDYWFLSLGLYAYSGYYPEPSYGSENLYPHLTGKPSSYPAQSDLDRNLAQPVNQILVINSPVTVMITMEDGREVGIMPNEAGFNEAPMDVSFYALPKEDGNHSWFFFLPDQAADVTVYGQDEGTVHIALVSDDQIVSYGPQHIYQSEAAEFTISGNSTLGTLNLGSGGTVEPFSIPESEFSQVMGVMETEYETEKKHPQAIPTMPEITSPSVNYESNNSSYLTIFCIGLCCCFIVIIVIVLTIIFINRNRKKRHQNKIIQTRRILSHSNTKVSYFS